MKGNDQVLDFSKDGDHKKAFGKLEKAELIFCLDFSVLNRVNELAQ